ncbi:MAG: hypothetical protein V3T93_02690, partial [Alphaproteobacteria bacterium]
MAAQGAFAAQGFAAAQGFFAAQGFWATLVLPCHEAAGPGSPVRSTPPMPTPTPTTIGATVVDNSPFLNDFM